MTNPVGKSILLGPFYFGCVGRPGHYYFTTTGERIYGKANAVPIPWEYVDGKLTPRSTSEQGKALVTHKDGWTALAFEDRTVDSRPGSNSTFLFNETLDFDEILDKACNAFPDIAARWDFPIVEVKE